MENTPVIIASVLTADRISCGYGNVHLHDVNLAFLRGSFNVVVGSGGVGKKLLVQVLGLLQTPASGDVLVEGQPTRPLSEDARATLRNMRFGYVFSAPFLLSSLTVVENVAMPLFRVRQMNAEQARTRCEELLHFVGLTEAAQQRVAALPLTAQHAVSVARGLANEPALLMVEDLAADLTPDEGCEFTALLRQACRVFGTTVIAAASPAFVPDREDRVIELSEGMVRWDSLIKSAPA